MQVVLRTLLSDPTAEVYGLELGQAAGLPSGTVHPILARLEAADWVTSRWEDIDARAEGRPRRRYYQLSEHGTAAARQALAELTRRAPAVGVLRPGLAGGSL